MSDVNYMQAAFYMMWIEVGKDEDPSLVWLYTLLALTTGTSTTLENVHDAWATWRTRLRPDHHFIVPFNQLSVQVQEKDRPYMKAIHRVATKLRNYG